MALCDKNAPIDATMTNITVTDGETLAQTDNDQSTVSNVIPIALSLSIVIVSLVVLIWAALASMRRGKQRAQKQLEIIDSIVTRSDAINVKTEIENSLQAQRNFPVAGGLLLIN